MTWLEIGLMAAGSVLIPWLWHRHENRVVEQRLSAERMRANIEVFFSPDGGCELAICNEVQQARELIMVMAYYLTNVAVIDVLMRAVQRGVKVRLITDNVGDNSKLLEPLLQIVDEWWVDKRHAIMHNKVMVIDGRVVITGSFNFTENAEQRNAENLLILRSHVAADRYAGNWFTHKQHSVSGKSDDSKAVRCSETVHPSPGEPAISTTGPG